MNIIVFTGPTLSAAAARSELDADYLPPVSQGDVYRAALQRPRAIAIIDGYFERVPAVWHKEILWALSRGIQVFGASSMGALRAAELHSFGMQGVGSVFEDFRDGVLEDDDEVAVAHGSVDTGYRATSEAMVNIRKTLALAAAREIISVATQRALVALASLYYPERVYPALLARAQAAGVAPGELAALRAFLPAGRVNQKRDDAIELLRTLRARAEHGLATQQVDFRFEQTEFWARAERVAGEFVAAPAQHPGQSQVLFDQVLDELRLEPVTYGQAVGGAMLRHLQLLEAERRGVVVDAAALERASDQFRRQRGLYQPAEVQGWMRECGVGWGTLLGLLQDEARCAWVDKALAEVTQGRLREQLTLSGHFARLLARAGAKQAQLEQAGLANSALEATGLSEAQLIDWYFEVCAGMHRQVDPEPALRALGFSDRDDFQRVALHEYLYRNGRAVAEVRACQ